MTMTRTVMHTPDSKPHPLLAYGTRGGPTTYQQEKTEAKAKLFNKIKTLCLTQTPDTVQPPTDKQHITCPFYFVSTKPRGKVPFGRLPV